MSHRIDASAVREAWDALADAYDERQRAGADYYRSELLGPAQVAVCGDVRGLRVLDVACGAGWFAREMARGGATVVGADVAPRMIARARRHEAEAPLGIAFVVADAERLDAAFAPASFDLATSCIALQDVPDPAAALRAMHAVLRPGGRAVASITHPCSDMPYRAWIRDDAGRKVALSVDRYFERTAVEYRWQTPDGERVTPALHAPLADWFAWALGAGFSVRGYHEPRPTDDALRARPDLADAGRVPYYALFDLVRD